MAAREKSGTSRAQTRRAAARARRRKRAISSSVGGVALLLGGLGGWLGPGGGMDVLRPQQDAPVVAARDWADVVRGDSASRGGERADLAGLTDEVAAEVANEGDALLAEELLGEGAAALPEPGSGLAETDVAAGLLSLDVPRSAGGTLVVVPGSQAAPGPGEVRTIRIEVEAGLDVDLGLFAHTVMSTLNDPRGWGADGSITFARTDGDADLRVVLASPALVDTMCAPLETVGKVSCGIKGHAVLNYLRWVDGSQAWAGDKVGYRQYLVNHEVGHVLGHRHEYCGGSGELAPLMQQQTGSMAPCKPNPWPAQDV
ncbi:DUF3152 domain-containing protein [Cellulomonas timonensis]|uniref:DUF3152 domain-containing protein n=1 Tax=Cellulomonas timonensis TaxID=1689271 RepID=UPI00082ECC29|nr:DUF3152 domain-containing protein [Cellulomonas timonensis]